MDNKDKPLEDILDKYNEYKNTEKSSDWEWLMGLAMISSLFGSGFGSSEHKYDYLDKRLTALEAKQDMIEKIILK